MYHVWRATDAAFTVVSHILCVNLFWLFIGNTQWLQCCPSWLLIILMCVLLQWLLSSGSAGFSSWVYLCGKCFCTVCGGFFFLFVFYCTLNNMLESQISNLLWSSISKWPKQICVVIQCVNTLYLLWVGKCFAQLFLFQYFCAASLGWGYIKQIYVVIKIQTCLFWHPAPWSAPVAHIMRCEKSANLILTTLIYLDTWATWSLMVLTGYLSQSCRWSSTVNKIIIAFILCAMFVFWFRWSH